MATNNVAGFPYDFSKMHNQCGDYARLVTLHRNVFNYPEDLCLDLPYPKGSLTKFWHKQKERAQNKRKREESHYFRPKNFAESLYFKFEDIRRKRVVERTIQENNLDDSDIIFYDSGIDFYRNSAQAKKWKEAGKKIILCYYGSDLRIRGIVREMEELADFSITGEYDHLKLNPKLEFMFYPYDSSELPERKEKTDHICRIAHSPTHRLYRGTDQIIEVIEELKKIRKFEFCLLENMPRHQVLEAKSRCDIGIECIGNYLGASGYGKSGLEMFAFGAPVVTSMPEEYSGWLPENPFIVANTKQDLHDRLLELIDNPGLVARKGEESKRWLEKYHGLESVNRMLYKLYHKYGII